MSAQSLHPSTLSTLPYVSSASTARNRARSTWRSREVRFEYIIAPRILPGLRREIASDNALGLYRECGGVVQPGNKTKPIAGAFPIQPIELSR